MAYYEQKQKSIAIEHDTKNNDSVNETANAKITEKNNQENENANIKRMNDLGYLTIEQAHEYLGINVQIIASARQNNELDSKKVGKRFFYKKEDLNIWFEIYLECKGDKTKQIYLKEQKNKTENRQNV